MSSGSTTPIYSGSIVFQNGSRVTTDVISSDAIIQAYEDMILVDKRLPSDTHIMVKNFLETNES